MSAARSGELNPNTYFADWKDGVPAGWTVWNPADGCAVKQKEDEEPGKPPTVQLVPSREGYVDFSLRIPEKEASVLAGDSLLLEMELRADSGAPVELMLKIFPDSSGVDLHLPYTGEGVWRTLRISVKVPETEIESVQVAVRLRGVKQGTIALVRRASLMLIPPV